MLEINEGLDISENEISDTTEPENPEPIQESETDKPLSAYDRFEKLRRSREIIHAKVIKWSNNGLEVELEGGIKAAMPNNHIDLDPDRNIAKYFGKTVPVRVITIR